MKDYADMHPSEAFFKDYETSRILFGQSVEDARHRNIEGDFRLLENGAYIEIRIDKGCFSASSPTDKIPIEIINPYYPGNVGWQAYSR